MLNYKELLKKYIFHVGTCRGVDFIHSIPDSLMTNEEISELELLSTESEEYYEKRM